MHPRLVLVIGMLCVLSVLCSYASSAQPAAAPEPVLDSEAGLQHPVTFSDTKIPLGELVQRVSKETGVKLYADRAVADEPAVVVVTEMPALRLLNQLARFFDYRWTRETVGSGARYRLYQDRKQQAAEEALRAAVHADEQRRMQIAVEAYAKVGQLTEEQYFAQREALERRRQKAPRPSAEEDRSGQGLRECGSSAKRALARMLVRLPQADWQALWRGERLRLYSKPRAGQRGLPEDITRSIGEFRPGATWDARRMILSNQDNVVSAAATRQHYQRLDRIWAAAEGFRVVIRLHRGYKMSQQSSRAQAAPSLTAELMPLMASPDPTGGIAPEQIKVRILSATTQPAWGYDSPERLAELEKDPVFTSWQPFAPRTRPVTDWRDRDSYGQIPELLPDIARAYGVSFLGDSYWSTPTVPSSAFPAPPRSAPAAAPRAEAMTLGSLLTRISGHYDPDVSQTTYNYYRWDRDDKLVLLRDRAWFMDRPKEIPLHLVARWKKLFEELGCLPMQEYADGVASLSDDQWDTIAENSRSSLFSPGFKDIPFWDCERHMLRLYRALSPAQRRRLEQGAPLLWSQMNGPQRELFLSQVEEQNLISETAATPADLAEAYLSLTAKPVDLIRREEGVWRREQSVPAGTDPKEYPEQFGDAAPDATQAPAGTVPPVTYRRFPALFVTLLVHCGQTQLMNTSFTVARPAR